MKKIIAVALLLFALSCSDEEESNIGCLTGILKGTNYRVTIRCCTRQEYLAGNNVNAGGTSNWTDYTSHDWEKCSACN